MAWLLILVILCLVITFGFSVRIILAAHRRAARKAVPGSGANRLDDRLESTSPDHLQSSQTFLQTGFEEPFNNTDSTCLFIAHADAYADPIDGVPFLPGEFAIACACGLTYRAESLDWLAVHCGGQCVQCGATIGAGQPTTA